MRRPIAFSGPSLTPEDRASVPSIEFRPPAAQGDIIRAIADRPVAIGLIDGYFGDRLAVHQKEILEAMAEGIPVLGAASMGALRAAELNIYGMQGVGQIFEDYKGGLLTSDAEVAVAHGPESLGFVPTSISLVDVRATVAALEIRGDMEESVFADVLKSAKSIYFADRTWSRIAAAISCSAEMSKEIETTLRGGHVRQKRRDAVKLLERVRNLQPLECPKTFPPPITRAYSKIRQRAGRSADQLAGG